MPVPDWACPIDIAVPIAQPRERDSRGPIKRSSNARRIFRDVYPCPSTGATIGACPGYVIDHIRALKHGGTDTPDNMQWQTREEAKAKDRIE